MKDRGLMGKRASSRRGVSLGPMAWPKRGHQSSKVLICFWSFQNFMGAWKFMMPTGFIR